MQNEYLYINYKYIFVTYIYAQLYVHLELLTIDKNNILFRAFIMLLL
jgi:hypothetical protein